MSKFNLELKKEAINQYQSGTAGTKSIAKSLGVNHEVLRMWIKQGKITKQDKAQVVYELRLS